MLRLIDRLAGWWLDFRTDQEVKNNPELGELGIKKLDVRDGQCNLVAVYPGVAILADEAAQLLKAYGAENYIQFDMMPRLDRGLRAIRVTVQWANGLSPSQKVTRLEAEIERLKGLLDGGQL